MTEAAKALLAKKGWDPQFGARPLRRAIQRKVEDELAEEMLKGTFSTPAITSSATSIRTTRETKVHKNSIGRAAGGSAADRAGRYLSLLLGVVLAAASSALTLSTTSVALNPAQQQIVTVSGATAPLTATLDKKLVNVGVSPDGTSVTITATQAVGDECSTS